MADKAMAKGQSQKATDAVAKLFRQGIDCFQVTADG